MADKLEQENLPGFDRICAEADQRDISPETREAFLKRKQEQWKKYMKNAKNSDKAHFAAAIKQLSNFINANGQ